MLKCLAAASYEKKEKMFLGYPGDDIIMNALGIVFLVLVLIRTKDTHKCDKCQVFM